MKFLQQSDIKLKSFSFEEKEGALEELIISKINLENLNLLIGNNAQGKTKIFKALSFIKTLLSEKPRQITTDLSAQFNFETLDKEEVTYTLNVIPSNTGNQYTEMLTREKELLLSTEEKKLLLNEETHSPINNFFVPQNVLAISAINEPQFKTIKLVREFFLRILFIDANKTNAIVNDPGSLSLNSSGTNLASMLHKWSTEYPDLYQEVKEDFIRCFPFIKDINFIQRPLGNFGMINLLTLNEKNVSKDIDQSGWSDGLFRALCLICLPKTQFKFDSLYPPSLICIDEIENGLDFNTLRYMTNYLKIYSENVQVIMSSHSPLMGQFIHPQNWQIVKRKGSRIKVTRPLDVEPNLDEQLNLYRQEYWDFYEKHINASDLYEPE